VPRPRAERQFRYSLQVERRRANLSRATPLTQPRRPPFFPPHSERALAGGRAEARRSRRDSTNARFSRRRVQTLSPVPNSWVRCSSGYVRLFAVRTCAGPSPATPQDATAHTACPCIAANTPAYPQAPSNDAPRSTHFSFDGATRGLSSRSSARYRRVHSTQHALQALELALGHRVEVDTTNALLGTRALQPTKQSLSGTRRRHRSSDGTRTRDLRRGRRARCQS
jgi:hypothetical protein